MLFSWITFTDISLSWQGIWLSNLWITEIIFVLVTYLKENDSTLSLITDVVTAGKVSVLGVCLVRTFRIWTEHGKIWSRKTWMRENKDQKNSEYGHFSRNAFCSLYCWLWADFTNSFTVSVIKFEKPNASWDITCYLTQPEANLGLLQHQRWSAFIAKRSLLDVAAVLDRLCAAIKILFQTFRSLMKVERVK